MILFILSLGIIYIFCKTSSISDKYIGYVYRDAFLQVETKEKTERNVRFIIFYKYKHAFFLDHAI